MIYGQFAPSHETGAKAQEPHLTLSFQREMQAPRSLFLDLTAQGAQAGIALERLRQPDALATKFGMVETADATFGAGETRRACLAFAM